MTFRMMWTWSRSAEDTRLEDLTQNLVITYNVFQGRVVYWRITRQIYSPQTTRQLDKHIHIIFHRASKCFICTPTGFEVCLWVEHDLGSPVPPSGYVLSQHSLVVVRRVCHSCQPKVTYLCEEYTTCHIHTHSAHNVKPFPTQYLQVARCIQEDVAWL